MLKSKQIQTLAADKISEDDQNRLLTQTQVDNLTEVHSNAIRKSEKSSAFGVAELDAIERLLQLPSIQQITKLNVSPPKSEILTVSETVSFDFPDINVLKMASNPTSIAYSCGFDNADASSFTVDPLVSFYNVMRLAKSITMHPEIVSDLGTHKLHEYDLRDDIEIYTYTAGDLSIDWTTDRAIILKQDGTYLTVHDLLPIEFVPDMGSTNQDGFNVTTSSENSRRQAYEVFDDNNKDRVNRVWQTLGIPTLADPEWMQILFDTGYYLDEFEMVTGGYGGNDAMPTDFKIQVCQNRSAVVWEDAITVSGHVNTGDYVATRWSFPDNTIKYEGLRMLVFDTTDGLEVEVPEINLLGANVLTYNEVETFAGPIDEATFASKGIKSQQSLISALNNDLSGSNTLLTLNDVTMSNINIGCKPKPRMSFAVGDIDISNTIGIADVEIAITNDASTARFVLSIDSGASWLTWGGSAFVPIDVSSLSSIVSNGMTESDIENLSSNNWLSLGVNTVRFGYYLADDVEINSLELVVNQNGKWARAVIGLDYDYFYLDNNTLEVQFLTAGDYKVNYYG